MHRRAIASVFPAFTIGTGDGRRRALALTAGLHLLAALFWLNERRQPSHRDAQDTRRVVSILLQPPLRPPARASRPPLPPLPAAAPRRPPPKSLAPLRLPPAAALPGLPPAREAALSPETAPETAPAEAAAPAPLSTFSLDQARRQAGGIDRELRKGKSGVPAEADTPLARLRQKLDDAHVEALTGVQQDSYTAPDGRIIYRTRVGKRTVCRISGSVGLGIAGARGINDAGSVSCPTGVEWQP
jgi:hypothetical protein